MLVFEDESAAPIRDAVRAKRVEIYIDALCEAELVRVLARSFAKRTLDAAAQEACLAQVRRIARRIDTTVSEAQRKALPSCRDADDQKLLEAAAAARADVLVTKDRALLRLARQRSRVPFRILTPIDLRVALASER